MKKTFRLLAGALALLMLLPALVGCSLPFGKKTKLPDKQKVTNVYRYEETEIATVPRTSELGGDCYFNFSKIGDKGYAYVVEENDKEYTKSRSMLHIGDYTTEQTILLQEIDNKSYDENAVQEYSWCQGVTLLDDCVLVSLYHSTYDPKTYEGTSGTTLRRYAYDGTLLGDVDLQALLGIEDISLDNSAVIGDTIYTRIWQGQEIPGYPDGVDILGFTLDGGIQNGYKLMPADATDYYFNKFMAVGDKLMVGVESYTANESTCKFITLDPKTGERSESGDLSWDIFYYASVDAEGNFYYTDSTGVFAYDLATGTKTEVMNFLNSDYIYNYGQFTILDRDHFTTEVTDYGNSTDDPITLSRAVFTKVPDEEIPEKYLITVASAGYTYNFQEQIVKFNLASDEYRICYKDYSQYNTEDDYTLGAATLNQDLLKGVIPDILIADQQFNAGTYINKGIFADLYTFMDKDETLGRPMFLENVLSACEIGGKLYSIPSNIYLNGILGKKETLAPYKGITMPKFLELTRALPEGTSFFRDGDSSREEMLQQLFFINYVNFVDQATGTVKLNNEDFKALLEVVAPYPEKSMWEDMDYDTFDWEAYENMFKEGKALALLTSVANFSGLNDYAYQFESDDLDLIGAPAPDGDGLVFSSANLEFLISATSPFADPAWEFIKIFFEDEYQTEQRWGFPVTKSALEKKKQEALDQIEEMKKRREEQEQGDRPILYASDLATEEAALASSAVSVAVDGPVGIPNPVYIDHQMTVEQVEYLYSLVTSVHKRLTYDSAILDIIKEEASAYFAGKKSLDETVALAENRVNIKISESR